MSEKKQVLTDEEICAIYDGRGMRSAIHEALPFARAIEAAVLSASGIPKGYALVPIEPTPTMIYAAEEAHMPFGDMKLAITMAILAAPYANNGIARKKN